MADLKISQLTSATTPLAGTEVVPLVQSSTTKKVTVANLTAGRDVTTKSLTAAADTGVNPASPLTVQIRTTTNDTGWSTTNPWGRFSFYSEDTSDGGAKTLAAIDAVAAATSGGLAKVIFKAYDGASLADVFQIDFDKNIKISTAAKGVNFTANTPAAGMTSQLLNWYEEGTWTFTLFDAATGGNASATTATGYYTRVGRVVTCTVNLVTNIDTTGMTAGNRLWFSLPFSTTLSGSGSAQLSQFVFGASAFVTPVVTNASRGFFAITINNNTTNQIIVSNLTSGQSDIQYLTLTYQI